MLTTPQPHRLQYLHTRTQPQRNCVRQRQVERARAVEAAICLAHNVDDCVDS